MWDEERRSLNGWMAHVRKVYRKVLSRWRCRGNGNAFKVVDDAVDRSATETCSSDVSIIVPAFRIQAQTYSCDIKIRCSSIGD